MSSSWVLLNTEAHVGRRRNRTTASAVTRNWQTVQVSLCPACSPPHPSELFVHSAALNSVEPPRVPCAADDLLLLCLNMGRDRFAPSPLDCDYFVYRAAAADLGRPSLQLLQRPHPFFNDRDVSVLPRSDGRCTLATLIATTTVDEFKLHLFESKTSSWRESTVSVEAPQLEFPVKIPRNSSRLHSHLNTTVITIGGEGGTMGWVDLWRGILFCDMLRDEPSLLGVPLPLPMKELSYNNGKGMEFGFPGQRRGIAVIRDSNGFCLLKFVHLEISDTRLPNDETRVPVFHTHNWVVTTWSNTEMTNSYESWHEDYAVQASGIAIDSDPEISQLLHSGLLLHTPRNGEEPRALQGVFSRIG